MRFLNATQPSCKHTSEKEETNKWNKARQFYRWFDKVSYFGRILENNDLPGCLETNMNDPIYSINDACRIFADIIQIDNILTLVQTLWNWHFLG